jgi:3-carboxy-cis,cis-muconate cycloisomerase
MTALLWPGDDRAGGLMSDDAVLTAMVATETAWLAALAATGVAPADAACDLGELVGPDDLSQVAGGSEAGGNPVIPLVALLRERAGPQAPAGRWLHRGLTSQDVLDTALVLCAREVVDRLQAESATQVTALAELADRHRHTVMAGRTLTQHAVPISFGVKAASWLHGVLDAAEELTGLALPVQFGGAAGTLAAAAHAASLTGAVAPAKTALDLVVRAAAALGLAAAPPWHTSRATITRLGDALVRCTDAYGRIANDVLTLSRPEIAELSEPATAGRGGSSSMPQKVNPVLSVLVRRAALAGPALAAQLHLAAAAAVDERPDGAWHVEWPALQLLARRTVVAAAQTTELLTGLTVHPDRMRGTAVAAAGDLLAERRSLAAPGSDAVAGPDDPGSYLGAAEEFVDAVLDRAARYRSTGS